ncbi:MAG: DegT/DnrJ/EryC1/StrS family aminotransferase, partial [Planctomycetes bacterium]|nr:DegT/DnrJ/EryC1/StrS family aminotransferase [Planctomycetota bacterium]
MAEKLAIEGGTPILTREDYKNWPVITEDDRRFVNDVLDSGIVAGPTGPQVSALEKE